MVPKSSYATEKNLRILSALKSLPQTIPQLLNTTGSESRNNSETLLTEERSMGFRCYSNSYLHMSSLRLFWDRKTFPNKPIFSETYKSHSGSMWVPGTSLRVRFDQNGRGPGSGPLFVQPRVFLFCYPFFPHPLRNGFQWHQKPEKINSSKGNWLKKIFKPCF